MIHVTQGVLAVTLFWVACIGCGALVCGRLKEPTRLLVPPAGAAVVLAALSILHQFLPRPALAVTTLAVLGALGYIAPNRPSRTELAVWTVAWTATVVLLLAPHVALWGFEAAVPAFMTANDSVIHAIFARPCAANAAIAEKIYAPGLLSDCAAGYPRGAHSFLWWLGAATGARVPQVHISALILYSLTVFPVWAFLDGVRSVEVLRARTVNAAIAVISVASFLPTLLAYHGFLPQPRSPAWFSRVAWLLP